ncbi:hypothetical protein Tco_0005980 [Tanacetum coccineum]
MDSWGSYHITYMRDYLVDFEEYNSGSDQEDIEGKEAIRRISYWVKDQDGCCKELSMRWNRRRIIHLRWNLMGRSITVMSRSMTGYGLMIRRCAWSIEAMLHPMVALLTTEAGCMTFTDAWKKEAIWLRDSL